MNPHACWQHETGSLGIREEAAVPLELRPTVAPSFIKGPSRVLQRRELNHEVVCVLLEIDEVHSLDIDWVHLNLETFARQDHVWYQEDARECRHTKTSEAQVCV